ncbi:chromosome segregation protein SMC [Alphaproteobacteria bacterium]|nr:chromosome segregation protein SMC [Alphaproteobacteria bacterium]
MFISKLRLSGFKSFSDDTSLSINTGLNGIIGPNGSGKSNIVEAIKWVMGENSSKSLRGSGMNDLIFGGSASKASKNIALVSLRLEIEKNNVSDSNKKYLKDGVIEVERQILRDSGSTYRINGKEVRAKDVQFLFADFSSGSRSSNIIDQGTVGSLIMQKPIERRRILDEAAGISGISARKNETSNKLLATKRNIERLTDILDTKKDSLAELQKQANKAKYYKETLKKINELSEITAIARWKNTKVQLNYKISQLHQSKEKLIRKKVQLKELEELILNQNTAVSKLENEKKEISEKNLLLSLDIEKINFEMMNRKNDLLSLSNLKEQIKRNLSFQNEILENSTLRLKEVKREIEKTEKEKVTSGEPKFIEASLVSIQKKYNIIEENLIKLNNELNQEKQLVSQSEFEITISEKNKDNNFNNINVLKKEILEKKSNLSSSTKLANLKIDINKCTIAIEGFNQSIFKINDVRSKTRESITFINDKIEKLKVLNDNQKYVLNDLEKKISTYLSLGFKTTEKSILKEINITNGYRLAFCLAIGDGIEAENSKDSYVKWEEIKSLSNFTLAEGLTPLSKYVKGPKKLASFLSQVAVVNTIEEGNRTHKLLKNGQISVTKQGSLWRWDGLVILDGKKTFTFKRIASTTKILELEKQLAKEKSKFLKIEEDVLNHKKSLESDNKKLKELDGNFLDLNNALQGKQRFLNNLDKDVFIENSYKDTLGNDLSALDKSLIATQKANENLINKIEYLRNNITEKSSVILNIRNKISQEVSALDVAKKELDKKQLDYALNKQKRDTIKLEYSKNLQEIKETERNIITTKDLVVSLNKDLKEADKKITQKTLNPMSSGEQIKKIETIITENKKKLTVLESGIFNIHEKCTTLKEESATKKNKLDELNESCIRKDAQITELSNFIKMEADKIKNDLNIEIENSSSDLLSNKKYDINIKEVEGNVRKLKLKNEQYSNVNLSAEKDAFDLQKVVAELDFEEKDLTRAAKKLEKAIEELNKESRARILNTFEEINITFSTLFKKLFSGGKAYLELIDSSDPLEAGLELMVSPPGKKLQKLSLLSGGEKALASLALIFSTFINKSSPICILDEVDAPLDEGNVVKFCELLKEATRISKKRFLVVTHNKITMGYMNKLYGITMLEPGSSKILSVNLDQAESVFAAE